MPSFNPEDYLWVGFWGKNVKKTVILSHFIPMVRLCEPISRPLGELDCSNLACHIIHHVKFHLLGYYSWGVILVFFNFCLFLLKNDKSFKNSYLDFHKGLEAEILQATWCQSCCCSCQILWQLTKYFGLNIVFFKILHFFEHWVPGLWMTISPVLFELLSSNFVSNSRNITFNTM